LSFYNSPIYFLLLFNGVGKKG